MGHLGHAGRGGEAPYRTPPPDSGQASVNQATPPRGGGAGSEPSAGNKQDRSPGPSEGPTDGSQVHDADRENASPDPRDVPDQPGRPAHPGHRDQPDQPEQTDSDGGAGDSLDAASADDPLVRFLHELCRQHNRNQAAKRLGVDRKTLYRALLNGRLTPRLRDALERERVAAEREAAGIDQQELALRVAGLERRLQDVEQQQSGGLGSLHEELAGLRAQVRTLGWTRVGGAASADAADRAGGTHRIYPDVVSVEALPDDEQVLRRAFALVVEWRERRKAFEAHWPQLEGLDAEVRMLELETALIDEHRLTLPPAQVPWEWWRRERELARRAARLVTARSALRRARWRRRLAIQQQVRRALRALRQALRHLRQARWRRLTGIATARSVFKRVRSMLWSMGQLLRNSLTLLRK